MLSECNGFTMNRGAPNNATLRVACRQFTVQHRWFVQRWMGVVLVRGVLACVGVCRVCVWASMYVWRVCVGVC